MQRLDTSTLRGKEQSIICKIMYLTGNYKTAFNYGKQKEVEDRYKHSEKLEDWVKEEQ